VARGDKDHKMLFDLRSGRRGSMVKVVYAVLAILMGASLFLTVGPFSIGEIFNSGGGAGDAAEPYEEQAGRIEARLKKDPQNPELLLSLTRAEINAGNAGTTVETSGAKSLSTEAVQAYQKADQAWSDYLKATNEPSAGLALVVAPMQLTLAELSSSYPEIETRINAATDAQKIVAEDRPSVNSLSTLSFYTYFTGDFKAAEKARAEAKQIAKTKTEREAIDKQLDEYQKNASSYLKAKEKAEKEQKAQGGGGGAVENPFGGGLGGTGLGE
jgi:hypothetical protein